MSVNHVNHLVDARHGGRLQRQGDCSATFDGRSCTWSNMIQFHMENISLYRAVDKTGQMIDFLLIKQ